MRKLDYKYEATKGKHFVLKNVPSKEEYMELSTYAEGHVFGNSVRCSYVDDGYVVEEDIPGWTKLKGYEVVYYYNGARLYAGNAQVFPTFEIAQKYKRNYKFLSNEEMFIEKVDYEGVPLSKSRIYNGKEVIDQEHYFGLNACEIGDYFTEDMVDEFMNALPPVCMRSDCAQLGEPISTRMDENGKYKSTYATFKRITECIWEYCGDCFRGENVQYGSKCPIV